MSNFLNNRLEWGVELSQARAVMMMMWSHRGCKQIKFNRSHSRETLQMHHLSLRRRKMLSHFYKSEMSGFKFSVFGIDGCDWWIKTLGSFSLFFIFCVISNTSDKSVHYWEVTAAFTMFLFVTVWDKKATNYLHVTWDYHNYTITCFHSL